MSSRATDGFRLCTAQAASGNLFEVSSSQSPDGTGTRPIAEGLFTLAEGEARLIGSQCEDCGAVTFPSQSSCPRCTSVRVRERRLGRRGTLWSWTIQSFPPKSPPYAVADADVFEPYGVGYVELAGEVRVESRLTVCDPAELEIGMELELTLIPAPGGETTGTVTYAFAPVAEVAR
jgi:uncharacterized protein